MNLYSMNKLCDREFYYLTGVELLKDLIFPLGFCPSFISSDYGNINNVKLNFDSVGMKCIKVGSFVRDGRWNLTWLEFPNYYR